MNDTKEMTLDQLYEDMKTVWPGRVREVTLYTYYNTYKNYLCPTLGKLQVTDITEMVLSDTFIYFRKKYAVPTIYQIKKVLSILFNYAIEKNILIVNHVQKIKIDPHIPTIKILSYDQMRKLIEESRGKLGYCELVMLAFTGIRNSELRGLMWKDIDFERKSIQISRTIWNGIIRSPKTRASIRTIDIPPLAIEALIELQKNSSNNTWVFSAIRGEKNQPYSSTVLNKRITKLLVDADLPHVTIHSFRHFHATFLLEHGISERATQERLGHSDPTVTARLYAHVTTPHRKKIINLLENFVKSD